MINKKYSEEQEVKLKKAYTACKNQDERIETIERFSNEFNKPKNSIIMKLIKLEVYVPNIRISKLTGGIARTKVQLVEDLEDLCGFKRGDLETVSKANKTEILKLIKYISPRESH